mmetsp:Transcript_46729/g.109994  ORF Transcript_46729/g.109994 Transcript_46729/m.109994 type:complete len:348 (+) Transcript_46729:1249-2292(+)
MHVEVPRHVADNPGAVARVGARGAGHITWARISLDAGSDAAEARGLELGVDITVLALNNGLLQNTPLRHHRLPLRSALYVAAKLPALALEHVDQVPGQVSALLLLLVQQPCLDGDIPALLPPDVEQERAREVLRRHSPAERMAAGLSGVGGGSEGHAEGESAVDAEVGGEGGVEAVVRRGLLRPEPRHERPRVQRKLLDVHSRAPQTRVHVALLQPPPHHAVHAPVACRRQVPGVHQRRDAPLQLRRTPHQAPSFCLPVLPLQALGAVPERARALQILCKACEAAAALVRQQRVHHLHVVAEVPTEKDKVHVLKVRTELLKLQHVVAVPIDEIKHLPHSLKMVPRFV